MRNQKPSLNTLILTASVFWALAGHAQTAKVNIYEFDPVTGIETEAKSLQANRVYVIRPPGGDIGTRRFRLVSKKGTGPQLGPINGLAKQDRDHEQFLRNVAEREKAILGSTQGLEVDPYVIGVGSRMTGDFFGRDADELYELALLDGNGVELPTSYLGLSPEEKVEQYKDYDRTAIENVHFEWRAIEAPENQFRTLFLAFNIGQGGVCGWTFGEGTWGVLPNRVQQNALGAPLADLSPEEGRVYAIYDTYKNGPGWANMVALKTAKGLTYWPLRAKSIVRGKGIGLTGDDADRSFQLEAGAKFNPLAKEAKQTFYTYRGTEEVTIIQEPEGYCLYSHRRSYASEPVKRFWIIDMPYQSGFDLPWSEQFRRAGLILPGGPPLIFPAGIRVR